MATGSQYQAARAIEDAGGKPAAHPVCFHALGFSLGYLRRARGEDERVIRLALDAGRAIDVAMSTELARELGDALQRPVLRGPKRGLREQPGAYL